MPVAKLYEAQMIVMDTLDRAGEIRAWATKVPTLTLSNLLRDALDRGWPAVRVQLEQEHGPLGPGELWAGKLASVPRSERAAWAQANPMPKAVRPTRRPRASTAS